MDGHAKGVWSVAVAGGMLVSGCADETVKVWGIHPGGWDGEKDGD